MLAKAFDVFPCMSNLNEAFDKVSFLEYLTSSITRAFDKMSSFECLTSSIVQAFDKMYNA